MFVEIHPSIWFLSYSQEPVPAISGKRRGYNPDKLPAYRRATRRHKQPLTPMDNLESLENPQESVLRLFLSVLDNFSKIRVLLTWIVTHLMLKCVFTTKFLFIVFEVFWKLELFFLLWDRLTHWPFSQLWSLWILPTASLWRQRAGHIGFSGLFLALFFFFFLLFFFSFLLFFWYLQLVCVSQVHRHKKYIFFLQLIGPTCEKRWRHVLSRRGKI